MLRAEGAGAAVLPDGRRVNRLAGCAVPQHGGLALVGDAECIDLVGGEAGIGERPLHAGHRVVPDVHRIVLDPAGLRERLRQFALRGAKLAAIDIEDNGASAGGALRSEEHTSELQSLMRISYAVLCLKKKK